MKARFTKDAIAAAALQLVDEAGLSALSMRSLAAALGTGPMTLYNYVADKEGLEELVVAAVVAEVRAPAPTDDWKTRRVCDRRGHVAGHSRPSRRNSLGTHPSHGVGHRFRCRRCTHRRARTCGLADRDRLAAFHAVLGFVVGAAQAELAGPFTRDGTAGETAARIGSVAGQEHAHIEALSGIAMQMSVEEDFDRGLQMLLDGIAARGTSKRRR